MIEFTVEEILERMESWDETYVVEQLGLTTHDLLLAFRDLIEDNIETFRREVDKEY